MGVEYQGKLIGTGRTFGIIVSRYNGFITKRLLEGAIDGLVRHGVKEEDIGVFWVPGAYEIPITAQKVIQRGKYDAVICLGAIIRGETPHFDFVASESAKGITQIGLSSGIPVIYGVITTETLEQAIDRAGAKTGNKGTEAALSAIEMVNLFDQI
ncbi:riboflavin synthase beta chain [Candidatus Kuenenia stuttgartiensis]|jgi:6,7-dimethyl-8-ribityllumazine synthase|uniref:6,7-dimethyl-8-ribityllumazine synthase n=1 Tax=Kuenenia stuttgartiensis TaxID=174633 RepID=Q1PUX0_KUEST|nr:MULTISPECIES: 6,7-dimethyl-8-ribityllumazine synthase [Kuenenia]MBE7546234.1 6,7-dimethyl-8-ribityllumazine synthase [Planctomycetia bacterium]MBW7942909.1 6,7-dimethyl-8-ribityllumazine synthase [Candidatus Kuenenia stuttgartiensis]MBZ0191173.1 6,7-dimethyl-8-ribityllumazine synthase [Candidatus Kuenenia stuttgartiensis]MCF6152948.1 6,7-dimethyl-8-ribityllumazine synthase [Candidatus Kuenenia stuttgartiensis]MCL4727031.1 6,7-dimethyl-8-ribityllumazine synthase [Candidatus Kuenenia stuttgar